MQKHLSLCSGKAGFTYSFDNGKILDYQDHYKNLGNLPFSIYFDFETTTGSVVFFDAKMYVVSYCIIAAFHPELNIPRLVIYRSYDQNPNELTSLTHFQALEYNFFNNSKNFNTTTLKQLENAAFSVLNKEKNTALAEMFNIELKFTVDCLKFWFQENHQILEIDVDSKSNFKQENPLSESTFFCLCNFLMNPSAENGWAEHVFKAKHLFLENIYSEKQMVRMGIEKFEDFSEKLNKILDQLDSFCTSVESENIFSKKNPDIEIVDQIKKIKTTKENEGKATKEKTIGFLYSHVITFLSTDKIKGDFPMSERFLSNTIAIAKNEKVIHLSHVTGKIIGYAHNFCNLRCKENYFTIPVLAHN